MLLLNAATGEDYACTDLDQGSAESQHSYIDHKQIRVDAMYAARLLRDARLFDSDLQKALDIFAERILRTGIPEPHVKNIGSWFYRMFLRDARQQADIAAHRNQAIGKNGMKIVSNVVLNSRQRQLASQRRYIERQEMVYQDEHGQEICIPFADLCNSPERRAAKHYVRALGLEKFCNGLDLCGFFLTLTLPPEYHPNPSVGKNSWSGLTAAQGHKEMQKRWRTFQRRFGKTIGIRVEEQHSDGCVHWHALVWITADRADELRQKLEKYFGKAPAIKIVTIDLSKASAATYLMKYLLKATGAEHSSMDDDLRSTSACSDAHRATWGGKSITFFDVKGSSSIWDELRRIKPDSPQYLQLSHDGKELHKTATENRYRDFLMNLQTMNAGIDIACKPLYVQTESPRKF